MYKLGPTAKSGATSMYAHLEAQGNALSSVWNGVYACGSKIMTWCKTAPCLKVFNFIMTKIGTNKLLTIILYV